MGGSNPRTTIVFARAREHLDRRDPESARGMRAKGLFYKGFSGSFGLGAGRRQDRRGGVRRMALGDLARVRLEDLERRQRAHLAARTDHQGRRGAARCAPRAPGGGDDARRELGLERTGGCQLGPRRGLEGAVLGRVLVGEQDLPARAQAVLEGVARGARPAGRGLRPARAGAVAAAGERPCAGLRPPASCRWSYDALSCW